MNILHVVNVFFVVPFFFGDQFKYFKKKGHKIFLVCSPSDKLAQQSKIQDFEYEEIPIQKKISPIQDLKSVYLIYKYVKKNNIDIVNGHTPKGGLLAMLASFIARIPKRIYFRHGLVFETVKGPKRSILIMIDRLTALLSTQVINVSSSVAKKSLEYKLNKQEKQLLLSKGSCSGIDIDRFNIQNINFQKIVQIKKELNISQDSIIIGFMGRLVRDKGIIELIDAFKRIHQEYSKVQLLIVGIAEKRDALPPSIMEEIDKNPDIIHTGYVNNEDIQNYYSLMNIYVLASYREGFPTSILEASSMELPVITTKVTGCIDAIIENKTGLFVNNSVDSIYQAIKFMIENPDLTKFYGKEGRKFVAQNFDQKIIWNEIDNLYK